MMNRRQFLVSLSAAGLLLGGCSRHQPINPPTPLKEIQPRLTLSRVWQQSIGSAGRLDVPGLRIVEHGESFFAAAGNGGVANISRDGQQQWKTNVGVHLTAGPSYSSAVERLYVGSASGDVICLDSTTGEQIWRKYLEAEVLAVTFSQNRVFVRTADGRLSALDAMSGQNLWVLDHEMPALSVRGMSPVVPLSNAILVGWEDGSVEALLQENGERAWESRIALPRGRSDIERLVDVQAALIVQDGLVFSAATNGKITALEAQSGNQVWVSGLSTWVDMSLAQHRLFVVAEDDGVRALSTDTGRVLWKQEDLRYRRLSKATAWGDGVVVVDGEGILHYLNAADGEVIARISGAVKKGLADAVAISHHRLLTLDVEGNLSLWQLSGE